MRLMHHCLREMSRSRGGMVFAAITKLDSFAPDSVQSRTLATILYQELKNNPVREHLSLLNAAPATKPDDLIIREIQSAKNYPRFWALINGDSSALTGQDRSGSAIDMAIVDIFQKFSKDPNQIERLWMGTPHGQREKTQNRAGYRRSTIKRSFDLELKSIAFNLQASRVDWRKS